MTTDPASAQRQYEALREEALEGRSWRSHSHLLLSTQGMAAWLAALATLLPPPVIPSLDGSRCTPLLPSSQRLALTRVLADMVLACSGGGTP